MESTGRLFLCASCRAQVLVCRRCDRGQCYCPGCARDVRRAKVREAGRRYQRSRQGRFTHAARSRRHRARRKIVTHQGSPTPTPDVLLATDPTAAAAATLPAKPVAGPAQSCCRFCATPMPLFVRTGFLRRRGGRRAHQSDRGGYSP